MKYILYLFTVSDVIIYHEMVKQFQFHFSKHRATFKVILMLMQVMCSNQCTQYNYPKWCETARLFHGSPGPDMFYLEVCEGTDEYLHSEPTITEDNVLQRLN